MDSSRVIIFPLVCATLTSALGIFVGWFVQLRSIRKRPFAHKVHETMNRISLGRGRRGHDRAERADTTMEERVERDYERERERLYERSEEYERMIMHLSRDANKAIGLGLITKEEVSALTSDSLSKSNLSFGLILPLSLFLYAVAFRLQFNAIGFSGVVFFVLLSNAALVVVGFERLCSYKLELQSLILGRFEKQQLTESEASKAKGNLPDTGTEPSRP